MAYKRIPTLCIEDAELLYKNFRGLENSCNDDGARNFCVYIDDDDVAQKLIEDGWNVKIRQPKNDNETPRYYIKVNVNFKSYQPPLIVMFKGRNRVELTEETVGQLDGAYIESVDLEISPYDYGTRRNGRPAYSGYVKEMYVTIAEGRFAAKHAAKEAPEEEPW